MNTSSDHSSARTTQTWQLNISMHCDTHTHTQHTHRPTACTQTHNTRTYTRTYAHTSPLCRWTIRFFSPLPAHSDILAARRWRPSFHCLFLTSARSIGCRRIGAAAHWLRGSHVKQNKKNTSSVWKIGHKYWLVVKLKPGVHNMVTDTS